MCKEVEESVGAVATAATEAKEPLRPCGQNLLSMTVWQFENSPVCSQSPWGFSAGPRGERHLCDADYGSRGRAGPGCCGVCARELSRGVVCSGHGSQTGRSLDRGQAEPPDGPSQGRQGV